MISAERNPASASVFIVNPLTGQGIDNLFRTHPRTEERIRRLQALATGRAQTRTRMGPWG